MKRGVLVDALVLRNEWSHIVCSGSVEVDAFSQQPAMINRRVPLIGFDLIVLNQTDMSIVQVDHDMLGGQNIDTYCKRVDTLSPCRLFSIAVPQKVTPLGVSDLVYPGIVKVV
jgi:hypothetical protein